jgi:hypothetical protein
VVRGQVDGTTAQGPTRVLERMTERTLVAAVLSTVVTVTAIAFALWGDTPWARTWAAGVTGGLAVAAWWHALHSFLSVTVEGVVVAASGLRGTVRLDATEVARLRISPDTRDVGGMCPVELVSHDGRVVRCWGVVWDSRYRDHRLVVAAKLGNVAAAIQRHGGQVTVDG